MTNVMGCGAYNFIGRFGMETLDELSKLDYNRGIKDKLKTPKLRPEVLIAERRRPTAVNGSEWYDENFQ